MKKRIFQSFALIAFLGLSISTFANTGDHGRKRKKQDHQYMDVAFKNTVGNYPVQEWLLIGGMDAARYMKDGVTHYSYFESNGELVGTSFEVSYASLPENARNYIQKHYSEYTPVRSILFDDNEANDSNIWIYGARSGGKDNYYIELSNGVRKVVLESDMDGNVRFFKDVL